LNPMEHRVYHQRQGYDAEPRPVLLSMMPLEMA
jgi:hypothetical protein